MALEDKDIFKAICDLYPGKPIEFIMTQYKVARQLNKDIEDGGTLEAILVESQPLDNCEQPEAPEAPAAPKKKYTRRSLKVKPQDAITDETIACCICGAKRKSLTSRHLAAHGITTEEYKKLCGYAPNQTLMSGNHHKDAKTIISRAQQIKLRKNSEQAQA